jgi:hypothetical protein
MPYINPFKLSEASVLLGVPIASLKKLLQGELKIVGLTQSSAVSGLVGSDGSIVELDLEIFEYGEEINYEGELTKTSIPESKSHPIVVYTGARGLLNFLEENGITSSSENLTGKSLIEYLFNSVMPVLPPSLRPIYQITETGPIDIPPTSIMYVKMLELNQKSRYLNIQVRDILDKYPDSRSNPGANTHYSIVMLDHMANWLSVAMHRHVVMLFDQGDEYFKLWRTRRVTPLASISSMIGGRTPSSIREMCMGKRVDFSGRSVISADPMFPSDTVGVPYKMLARLAEPIIINRLINDYRHHPEVVKLSKGKNLAKGYLAVILQRTLSSYNLFKLGNKFFNLVCDVIDDITDIKLGDGRFIVIMNRAPSLHRYSVQGMFVRPVSGKLIEFPNLSMVGFNFDCDGDNGAIHSVLTDESKKEVLERMMINRNLRNSTKKDNLIIGMSHELIAGAYVLSNNDGV